MIKFTYADGRDMCVYDGEKVEKYSSGYIDRYIENSERAARNSEWKHGGDGAIFRGDTARGAKGADVIECSFGGIYPAANDDWVVYSFTVNSTSGIYKKCLTDPKTPETHVINSNDLAFSGGCLDVTNGKLATSVKRNWYNADIAVFDMETGDYKCVTEGDTLDCDPFISPENANIIYFSSRGVGRDNHGGFVEYSPSVICRLDLQSMTIDEIAPPKDYSYFKPVYHGGKLYAIKAPVKEKRHNGFVEFLLFPWRILQAIASFINLFVTAFTGKSLTEGGANPARGREYDSKKIAVSGNLIDVDKQLKKNASKKDSDFGFIPKSWQLVEVESGTVIKSGIGDFDIAEDGTVIATNGRRIFEIKDGKCKKVCNADFCIRVNCRHSSGKSGDSLFGF
ncbi:MAG: hypothetical protein NC033_02325 [Clostridiales bacterium]|nr:hypothetical protein [Clostridiales bacterium]